MSNRPHALRLATIVLASVVLTACSRSPSGSSSASTNDRSAASGEHAATGQPAGRIEVGYKLARANGKATGQSCIDCHGIDGNAPIDPTFPKLGGQYHDYLAHALHAYRRGDREHPLMSPQAANLSDQDIADLAAYFGSRTGQLHDLQGLE